ncbi:helix-turn-helix domain-containing protein [Tunicatimonas pelagia]|uniref:helix-turn-helix domain-containing protein n=1 Tax=Tunicatimonas pelagia TaxID=931531 RepID=UPI0026662136|nr:helix-turn-helix transcriptional regulator [Tunicatimonas pelagia]WKN41393.1 helix-turn-helix transcriptional regulator [Tunicatimonas pelagia]
MVNANIEWTALSDKAIISHIGEYIKHQRLLQNRTQAKIAEIAGINRWTMSKIENGEPISLISLIQILRALNLLDILEVFKVQTQFSPLELAKLEKQKRQRASTIKNDAEQKESEW